VNSRERIDAALAHREPDHVPLDLGGSPVTGMAASSVYLLRQALGLDAPGTPVKVLEPFQMLGEIRLDLIEALGIDVVPLAKPTTMFGFRNEGWKRWTLPDGTPVLAPAGFNTEPTPEGDLLMYPGGDSSLAPSGRMPAGGFYFDAIIRQPPIDEGKLNYEDYTEEFVPISAQDLAYLGREAERLHTQTDKAILANFGGTSFGDIALVPAMWLRNPKGIRDVAEWYMSTVTRKDYVYKIFERQCQVGLANLARIHEVVGNRVTALFVTGTDFGQQTGTFISPRAYRDLYQPFHREINAWVHRNTSWKTLIHSCGSVAALIPDFIASGFDILNPVQTSAAGMDASGLKQLYGERITFWGGGIDTQRTLPFGTPQKVRAEVQERMRIFGPGGGFVFNTIHNVQARVPPENLLALYEAVRAYR
jgi:hypothetical protein